jgi:adenine-specific DNA-methyltransferase
MDKVAANRLITNTFDYPFDIGRYKLLSRNIFKDFEEGTVFTREGNDHIPEVFRSNIKKYTRLGEYNDTNGKEIDILIVYLNEGLGLDRARTLQRNFISNYLDDLGKDAALVAFATSDSEDWRFSLITIEYKTIKDETGIITTKKFLSNAKRFSFLVGKNEANHTAQQQIIPLLVNPNSPSIKELENAFSVEKVTNEFYQDYKKRFLELGYEITRILDSDEKVKKDFLKQNINTDNFAKKLMGQIVFLYFVQKKGWLGITKDVEGNFVKWGEGDKKFMRSLFEKKFCVYDNFFNDVLEPLFYEALANERANNYYSKFDCKIPFLGGGLFEAMHGYNWQETDITISNSSIEMILDTFDRYNFTVKEEDPLDKEVAIDPEMLGKVFENLLPENLKKGTGAFYTPRPIVHYMSQESLINYLDTNLKHVSKSDINLFVKEGEAFIEHDKIAITKQGYEGEYQRIMPISIIDNAAKIDELLTYVKICDPAIGSGAFPMGLLFEIVAARNVLTNYIGNEDIRTKYILKNECIQNSIYGVDIDEGAIEISKLRLWLSIIVDEDDIENIKPLPNLDYKIICGNSLISRYELDKSIDEVFREFNKKIKNKDFDNSDIRNLVGDQEVDLKFYKKLTNDFLSESSHNMKVLFRELIGEIKNAFKSEINNKDRAKLSEARGVLENLSRINIFGESISNNRDITKAKRKLERLEKQKKETQDDKIYKDGLEWRFEFPDLLNENGKFKGFDIVIGNPPYIQLQKRISKSDEKKYADIYENKGFETFERTGDIYSLFYERALNILKHKGTLLYITSNKWMRSKYGKSLRKLFSENNPLLLLDLGPGVFETATVDTNIIQIEKNINQDKLKASTINVGESIPFLDDSDFVNLNSTSIENWIILTPQEQNIKHRAELIGTPLKDWDIDINSGIKTGYNEAFIIDTEKRNELISLNIENKKIIKPLLRGKDLKKYYSEFKELWLLFIPWHFPLHLNKNITGNSILAENAFQTQFTDIYNHLGEYKDKLSKRNKEETGIRYEWYALQRCANSYFEDFEKDKIIYSEISQEPSFYLDLNKMYIGNTAYILVGDNLKYLLALLNSSFVTYIFSNFYSTKLGQKGYRYLAQYMDKLPIPKIQDKEQIPFEILADKIIEKKVKEEDTKELEDEVDLMVYKLYELSFDEVLVIDREFKMSEAVYNNYKIRNID